MCRVGPGIINSILAELHLTTLRGVVQMRPQFHHLDAATYLEQSNRRREANEASRVTEARAVHMNIKAPDGENVDLNNTKPFLIFAKEEDWATLKHSDEEVTSCTHSNLRCNR